MALLFINRELRPTFKTFFKPITMIQSMNSRIPPILTILNVLATALTAHTSISLIIHRLSFTDPRTQKHSPIVITCT